MRRREAAEAGEAGEGTNWRRRQQWWKLGFGWRKLEEAEG